MARSEEVDAFTEPGKYRSPGYDTESRFVSYWHQLNETLSLGDGKVLEVGIGSGLLSYLLRSRGVDLTTVDLDERLEPDFVADVTGLPFEDSAFSTVVCFEVLEHLPWPSVSRALSELHRVSAGHVLVSLPDLRRKYRVFFQFYREKWTFKKVLVLPWERRLTRSRDREHCWEIGVKGYPLSRIEMEFRRGGFSIERQFVPFGNPYHRFFKLRKA